MTSGFARKLTTTVAGGAIIVGSLSVLSRLLGLIRDRLLFSTFGAGDTTDIYFAAFKLPDLIFNIVVLGALTVSFVPVFLEYWTSDERRNEAWLVTNSILNALTILLAVLAALAAIFSHQLVPLLAPGFPGWKQDAVVDLTRIMLATIVFFGIGNVFGSVLNAFRKFVAYGFAPVLYNVGIIVGILFLAPAYGPRGLAWGVVLGAFLHMLIQIIAAYRSGFRHQRVMRLRHPGVRMVGKLIVPRMLGLAVYQVDQLVLSIIATTLAVGSLSVFTAANNLQHFPINVIGVSLAIASFPVFTQAIVENRHGDFVTHFSKTIRRILFLIIPLSVLILLLRAHIVRIVLGAGSFNWEDTVLTAQTLGFFSLSLFAQSLLPTITRAFYAMKDTVTPVIISAIGVCLNIIGSITLSRIYGVEGLAMSFSVVAVVQMMLLLIVLRRRYGDLDDVRIIRSVLTIILASACMGAGVRILLEILAQGVDQHTFVGIFLQGSVAGVFGIILYLIVAMLLHIPEVGLVRDWIVKRRRQLFNGNSNGTS